MSDRKKEIKKILEGANPQKHKPDINLNNVDIHIKDGIGFVSAEQVNINKRVVKKKILKYDEEKYISPAQAKKLKDLIDRAVKYDKAAGIPVAKSYAKWWGILKNHFNVPKYHLIPAEKGEYAIEWLRKRIVIDRPKLKLGNKKDRETWRKEHYKAIHARIRQLGLSKADLYIYCEKRFGKSIISLKRLTDEELEKLYHYIMSKKK